MYDQAFQGKTYLITGASSGIGAATALALAKAGGNVVLAARREAQCARLADQIISAGGKALAVRMDVGIESDIERAVALAVKEFGRLDGAFNNAGTLGQDNPTASIDAQDFENTMRINTSGVHWSMKHEIQAMLASGGGAIVNNASIVALVGFANRAPYNASKHAVMGLTQTAALEYFTQGIRVNAVCPGPVQTPMAEGGFGSFETLHEIMASTAAGRPGQVHEIAGPVLFLLSDAASYISGHGLVIDGGYTVQ